MMNPVRQPLRYLLPVLLLVCLLAGCRRHNVAFVRGMYYWKSNTGGLSDTDRAYLRRLGVQRLYVKLFEVGHSDQLGNVPEAKSLLGISAWDSLAGLRYIPVVFIRNNVFPGTTQAGLDTLADNIVFLVRKYYRHLQAGADKPPGQHGYGELQIDCDWTAGTKDKYFYLLKAIKRLSEATLSCTLRLYPYKYPGKMGIPPVDKATLMCYNLVSPLGNNDKNAILQPKELAAYLGGAKKYPLHLDVALPVYSWMQVYQNGHFSGILYRDNRALLQVMKPVKPLWYEVTADTVIDQMYLRAGDEIKYEQVTAADIGESIGLLKKHLPLRNSTTIILFHLDDEQLKQFTHETLDSFYTGFNAD